MFQFKHFSVSDEHCTMKVGTDGVLLGAWANVQGVKTILDIGTGCGLIALMLAQRSDKTNIDAVEIDHDSAMQARQNVENSPWQDRIKIHHASFREFSEERNEKYDLIVSNPPFFENSLKPAMKHKNISKHTGHLTFEELLFHTSHMMHNNSRFTLILPADQSTNFISKALIEDLYCTFELKVIPREGKTPKRCILEFTKQRQKKAEAELTIKNKDGSWTEEYQNLTGDFYLGF